MCALVAGVPLTVNAFSAEYRAGFQVLSLGLGLVVLTEPRLAAILLAARPRSVILPLVALWIYFLARVPATLDPPAALAQVLDRTALVTVMAILASGMLGAGRRAVIRAGLVGLAVVAAWGIAQRFGIHPFLDPSIWRPSRPTRPLGTHNLMGAYLAAWLPVATAMVLTGRGWRKMVWGGVTLLGLACFLLSESRGAWVALLVAMVAMVPWFVRGGAREIRALAARDRRGTWVVALAAVAVTAACAGSVLTRLETREQSGLLERTETGEEGHEAARAPAVGAGGRSGETALEGAEARALTSFERRTLVARTALDIWKEHLLFGSGPGSFRLAFYVARPPLMQRLEAETGETAVRAHADGLEIGAELGLVGIALVAIWLGLAARRAFAGIDPRRSADRAAGSGRVRSQSGEELVEAGIVAGGMALAFHALVDFPLQEVPTSLVGAVFLGLASGQRMLRAGGRELGRVGAPEKRRGAMLLARWLASLVLLGGITGAVCVVAADRAYRDAYAVLTRGDLAGSERQLERAMRLAPDQARDWVAYGEVARHRARRAASAAARADALATAAVRFDAAARHEPQIASRWVVASTALAEARAAGAVASVDSVRAFLDRALVQNPYLGGARAERAALAREEGEMAVAAAVLAAGEKLLPGDPRLALERGRLLGGGADPNAALAEFEAAARRGDRATAGAALDEIARYARADAVNAGTRESRATALLESLGGARDVDIQVRAGAQRLLGDLALESGDRTLAGTWYAEALATGGRSPELDLGLGNAAHAEGDLAEAERRYRAALEVRPEMAEAWQNLGSVAMARGDTAGALRFYAQALARAPANATLRIYVDEVTAAWQR